MGYKWMAKWSSIGYKLRPASDKRSSRRTRSPDKWSDGDKTGHVFIFVPLTNMCVCVIFAKGS